MSQKEPIEIFDLDEEEIENNNKIEDVKKSNTNNIKILIFWLFIIILILFITFLCLKEIKEKKYEKAKQYIANLHGRIVELKECPSCKENTLITQRYDKFQISDFVVACKNPKCKFFELYKITRNRNEENYKEYVFKGKYKNLSDVYDAPIGIKPE